MELNTLPAEKAGDDLAAIPQVCMLLRVLLGEPRLAKRVNGMWVFDERIECPRSLVAALIMVGLIARTEARPYPVGDALYQEFYITEGGRAALRRWEAG